jgi:fused signal recognition particle receptor
MAPVLIVIVVALVVVLGATLVFTRTRGRGGDATLLEPPPRRPVDPGASPARGPASSTAVADAPTPVGDSVEVDDETVADLEEALAEVDTSEVDLAEVEAPVRPRLRDRLGKARGLLGGYVGSIRSRGRIDAETWDELEEALLLADVGIGPTTDLLDSLRAQVKAEGLTTSDELLDALKAELKTRLSGFDRDLVFADAAPSVWLFVGVNGVGKTTTVAKVGQRQIAEGHRVVMAAGDTFRAAASEQLGLWAERTGADFVRGADGGDPSAVIFDAVERAAAIGADLVLADTAGRLHNKVNLMEELRKVRRVAEKGAGTVSEVLLVLDATTGQNGLIQAQQFTEAVELTGVVLTKLDGSAKGGIVVAIQDQLSIPVKLVGIGESVDDLVTFDADEFVDALFA